MGNKVPRADRAVEAQHEARAPATNILRARFQEPPWQAKLQTAQALLHASRKDNASRRRLLRLGGAKLTARVATTTTLVGKDR
eukprot:7634614-Pyramimonas_sp.AAC.1